MPEPMVMEEQLWRKRARRPAATFSSEWAREREREGGGREREEHKKIENGDGR